MKPTIVALALPMMILIAASFVDADCNEHGCCWCDNWGNPVECKQHKVPSRCRDGGKIAYLHYNNMQASLEPFNTNYDSTFNRAMGNPE